MTIIGPNLGMAERLPSAKALFVTLAVCAALFTASVADARLIIIATPTTPTAGTPPPNMIGGGDLITNFNQAAAYWEKAFPDDGQTWIFNIEYGWEEGAGEVESTGSAYFRVGEVGGTPNRILSGKARFDNSGGTKWFADSTPATNSEFNTPTPFGGIYTLPNAPGGLGWLNTGIQYFNQAFADDDRYDLLTISMHEIGHGLGLAYEPPKWVTPGQTFDISEFVSHYYGGYTVHLGSHVQHLENPSIVALIPPVGVRSLPGAQDILVMAQLSTYSNPVVDPYFEMIVGDLDVPAGPRASLVAKLRNARALRDAGNKKAARNLYSSFIKELGTRPFHGLTEEQREGLEEMAKTAIANL